MIGLDTNVVLRYLLQDDPAQTLQANHLFEQELVLANKSQCDCGRTG